MPLNDVADLQGRPPWIWATGFAVFLKTEEVRSKGEEDREVEDEEAPLLNSEES